MRIEEQSKERQLLERLYETLTTDEDKETFHLIDSYFRLGLQIERRDLKDQFWQEQVSNLKEKVQDLKKQMYTLEVLRDVTRELTSRLGD